MFTIDDVLSEENQKRAQAALASKKDGHGPDGVRVSEFPDYWTANHERIERAIRNGTYHASTCKAYEITGNTGKRREIVSINVVDRFIERLVQQLLSEHIGPMFLVNSFAYQPGKGTLNAAMKARDYIAAGFTKLCEIDIKDYFTSVDLETACTQLQELVPDKLVIALVKTLLFRDVEREGRIRTTRKGLLQGSSISPTISNLYLHPLDMFMNEQGFNWLRFADNIYVYASTTNDASSAFEIIRGRLYMHHKLDINKKKSGIYGALDRRVVGYDLIATGNEIEVRKHHYQARTQHNTWHASVAQKTDGTYHIVQDGIINQKDYSLLFENEEERHHIPVEVTDQINVYNNITVSPGALRTINRQGIRIAYFDDFGRLSGMYTPTQHGKAAAVFLKQCELYNDEGHRGLIAQKMEAASIHNMRANLRYYAKKGYDVRALIDVLSGEFEKAKATRKVSDLMLIEARARKKYYEGFSTIVEGAGFAFAQRTKRPPKDPCNALISFGNSVLYNFLLTLIWKTSLDPKIGIVHATNRRNYSLNLDFADIFKPIVVDRVIFSLVNRREIKSEYHFHESENGGVFLNAGGKHLFLERFEQKLDTPIQRGKRSITYRTLMSEEIASFQRMIIEGISYKPYKYY